jgi:hypothetical protein
LFNTECSGGISDDTPSDVPISEQRVGLVPAREGITGSGHADFEERADRTEFSVKVEDLADGNYRITIQAMNRCGQMLTLDHPGQEHFYGPGRPEFRWRGSFGKNSLYGISYIC